MNKKSRAAVFYKVGSPVEIRDFNLPEKLERGSAVCRVMFSTICGADLHTIFGRRKEPLPLILGHEIIGEIIAMGEGFERDGYGNKLAIGDRISWTIMASCGNCYYCSHGMRQKCVSLKKYGHASTEDPELYSPLVGGYAQYVYIIPGTEVFKVPAALSDEIATPANCALSTVVNAVETIGIEKGDVVIIQGCGLLGLNACALARESGAREVIATDINDRRLEMAGRFGATKTINSAVRPAGELKKVAQEVSEGRGADVAIEVSGSPKVVPEGIDALRIGGRYMIAGLTKPSPVELDGNILTRKNMTIKAIHNYSPEQLGKALLFLEKNYNKYPFNEIVGKVFSLDEINAAIDEAEAGKHIRVGIKP